MMEETVLQMEAIKNADLSKRAEIVANWEDFMTKYLIKCSHDEYNGENNPDGFINLGTAVNNMCSDILLPRLTSKEVWSVNKTTLQYRESYGIFELRKNLAATLTEFMESHEAVKPEDLFCAVGVTACIDVLAHLLADPGDVILAPTPIYGRIFTDLKQRAEVNLGHIPIITQDNTESLPELTLEKIKEAYDSAISQKQKVRGIILINPSNPLGDIYSPELMMDILNFCKEHRLHVIVDEVYALSAFLKDQRFHSVLKFPKLPDRERTHVLYGISKDFGIAGLRIGVIHTHNKVLQNCLMQLCNFHNIPFPVMDIVANFLTDLDWCRHYVSVNKQRLTDGYEACKKRVEAMGLHVRPSYGGFFLWVDFRPICGSKSFEQEMHFFHHLLEESHLYIVPGKELFCAQPGWFRITFTYAPDCVNEGLDRLEKAIKSYKRLDL